MSLPVFIPATEGVAGLYGDLYGADVQVKSTSTWTPLKEMPILVSAYQLDQGNIAVVSVMNLGLAAGLSGLLTRFPKAVVDEVIKSKVFTQEIKDNFHEIMNISASCLNAKGYAHISLHSAGVPIVPLNSFIEATIKSPAKRLDVEVVAGSYGQGRYSFFLAKEAFNLSQDWIKS